MNNPSTDQPEPDDPDPDDEPYPTSLNSMTKEQLLNYAEAKGISGVDGSMKKADILATIKE